VDLSSDRLLMMNCKPGVAVEQLVEALHYKPQRRGFDSG
jgi:hypothetical protein